MRKNNDVFREQFYKVSLCWFHSVGKCKLGDRCTYAHSAQELRPYPDITKTSICRAWREGRCPLMAGQCSFAHGRSELRMSREYQELSTRQSPGKDREDGAQRSSQLARQAPASHPEGTARQPAPRSARGGGDLRTSLERRPSLARLPSVNAWECAELHFARQFARRQAGSSTSGEAPELPPWQMSARDRRDSANWGTCRFAASCAGPHAEYPELSAWRASAEYGEHAAWRSAYHSAFGEVEMNARRLYQELPAWRTPAENCDHAALHFACQPASGEGELHARRRYHEFLLRQEMAEREAARQLAIRLAASGEGAPGPDLRARPAAEESGRWVAARGL